MALFAPLAKNDPFIVLAPMLGMMLITGPPTSASPMPPEVREHDFLGVADIGDVVRHAAAADGRSDRHAVHLEAALGEADRHGWRR